MIWRNSFTRLLESASQFPSLTWAVHNPCEACLTPKADVIAIHFRYNPTETNWNRDDIRFKFWRTAPCNEKSNTWIRRGEVTRNGALTLNIHRIMSSPRRLLPGPCAMKDMKSTEPQFKVTQKHQVHSISLSNWKFMPSIPGQGKGDYRDGGKGHWQCVYGQFLSTIISSSTFPWE